MEQPQPQPQQIQQQYPQHQDPPEEDKQEQLTQIFFTLVTNLVKKGGSAMIHLLGDFFQVSVDNTDPDELIDEFNAKIRDPEMQLKMLQFVQGINYAVSPALQEAINDAVRIFGDMLSKMAQQMVKVGTDVVETAPVVGEVVAGVKAIFDIARAVIAGVSATANTVTLGFNTANKIKHRLDNISEMDYPHPLQQISHMQSGYEQGQQQQLQPQYIGGKRLTNEYKKMKKYQTNTIKRIAKAYEEYNGTRKKNIYKKRYLKSAKNKLQRNKITKKRLNK